MPEMNKTSRRSGFTLVEMLIVLGVIATVAAIFIPIVLNMSDRNQVPKAASMLENALSLAKARAVAERRPNGIRLFLQNSNKRVTTTSVGGFAWYDEIQYIEDPGDYVEHWLWGIADKTAAAALLSVPTTQPFWSPNAATGPAAPPPGMLPPYSGTVSVRPGPFTLTNAYTSTDTRQTLNVARSRCLFGPISIPSGMMNLLTTDPPTSATFRSQRLVFSFNTPTPNAPHLIQAGDRIELDGVGELFTVLAISNGPVDIGTNPANRIFVPILVVDRDLPQTINVPLNGRSNYRAIRKPRPVPSLAPVKLPQDVVIDLTPTRSFFGPTYDLDTTNQYWMSGVSTRLVSNNITNLTIGATLQVGVPPPYVDIMFSPSGEILPTSQDFGNFNAAAASTQVGGFSTGNTGLIALWLHQWGEPNLWASRTLTAAQGNVDNQAIVAVNGRTGFIGSYPVAPLNVTTDPLANARLGKARISADTGQ